MERTFCINRFLFTPGARSLKFTVRLMDVLSPATSLILTSASTRALQISLTMPSNAYNTLAQSQNANDCSENVNSPTFSSSVADLVRSLTAALMRLPRSCNTMVASLYAYDIVIQLRARGCSSNTR